MFFPDTANTDKNREDIMSDDKKLWGVPEVAQALGMSEPALRSCLHRGYGPRPLRLGRRKLAWRPEDLEAWIELEARRQGVAYSQASVAVETTPRRRPGRPRKVGM